MSIKTERIPASEFPFYQYETEGQQPEMIPIAHRGGGILDPLKHIDSGRYGELRELTQVAYQILEGIVPEQPIGDKTFNQLQDATSAVSAMIGNLGVERTTNVLLAQNTLEAFESAKDRMLFAETDVIATKDGRVIFYHGSGAIDNPLVRMFGRKAVGGRDGEGLASRSKLQSMTLMEIKATYPNIITFEEGMEIEGLRLFIDPKTDEVVAPLAKAINKGGHKDRVSIGSFFDARTKAVADLVDDRIAVSLGTRGVVAILYPNLPGSKKFLETSKATSLQIPEGRATQEVAERAREMGLKVITWSAKEDDGRGYIVRSINRGDDGFMTNYVDLAADVLKQHNIATPTIKAPSKQEKGAVS